jgi:hypothetical protein
VDDPEEVINGFCLRIFVKLIYLAALTDGAERRWVEGPYSLKNLMGGKDSCPTRAGFANPRTSAWRGWRSSRPVSWGGSAVEEVEVDQFLEGLRYLGVGAVLEGILESRRLISPCPRKEQTPAYGTRVVGERERSQTSS